MKWEIEANIGCCNACRASVAKNLKGVEGVESVDLYPEISKVVVMGDADRDILLREVKKVKKKARILTSGASSPAKNLPAMGDELGRHSDEDKKKASGHAEIPVNEEKSKKAIAVYKPPKPSNGGDRVASESKDFGLKLAAYGFGSIAFFYRQAKNYGKK